MPFFNIFFFITKPPCGPVCSPKRAPGTQCSCNSGKKNVGCLAQCPKRWQPSRPDAMLMESMTQQGGRPSPGPATSNIWSRAPCISFRSIGARAGVLLASARRGGQGASCRECSWNQCCSQVGAPVPGQRRQSCVLGLHPLVSGARAPGRLRYWLWCHQPLSL